MASHHWFMLFIFFLLGVIAEYMFSLTGYVGLGA